MSAEGEKADEQESQDELLDRVRESLKDAILPCFWDWRDLPGGVIVLVLAVKGRPGVFVGYGKDTGDALVDAWRDFRTRSGVGRRVK